MALLTPETVFRRYETDGVPDSGNHKVKKDEVAALFRLYVDRSAGVLNVRDFGAKGDDLTVDTAAFQSWRAEMLATGAAGLIPTGVYRIANAFSFADLNIEFAPGASLKDASGGVWEGGAGNVYIGGTYSTPPAAERAFGVSGAATRVVSPSATLLVDEVGYDATVFPAPQSAFYKRHYRGKTPLDSYAVAPNHSVFVAYGLDMPNGQRASGSMPASSSGMKVYSAENGATGITEMQASAHYLRSEVPGQGIPIDVANGLNWWVRETSGSGKFQTAPGDYDAYLAGDTILVQKYTDGRTGTAGRPYRGAFGAVVTTIAAPGGFNSDAAAAYRTYPLDAMLVLSGFTGPSGAVANGHEATATDGAFIALQIGGTGGGIWTGDGRSRFNIGAVISDCIQDGLVVTGDHPLKQAGYNSIRTTPNSGRVVFGAIPSGDARVHIGGNTSASALGDAIKLYETENVTSKRTSINFNDLIVVGTDLGGNGGGTFRISHIPSGRSPLGVSDTGEVFMEALPTSASGTRVWKDGSGFLKVG